MRLTAEELSCRRGERILFRGVAFDLSAGSALRLVGPNGSGKTSLLRILANLLPVESGALRLTGKHDPAIPDPEYMTFIGVLGGVKPSLTVREHVRFWLHMTSRGAREADGIVDAWGLGSMANAPAGWLSAGQRRRLELARASSEGRPIWLLDEPKNGLDGPAVEILNVAVSSLRDEGGIVVTASHQALSWPGLVEFQMPAATAGLV